MPGTPKKREKIEKAQLNGEVTSKEAPEEKKHKGASAEFMREMTRKRVERQKRGEIPYGRAPKKRFTVAEREAYALEQLMPRAFKVLQEQLDSEDEQIRQKAAMKVMEYVKGKPTQTIKQEGSQVHTIRYETVAFDHTIELPAQDVMELESGDDAD